MSKDIKGRWDSIKSKYVDTPEIDAFLREVIEVCRRHGFSISHEDGHGSFMVETFSEGDAEWLFNANVDIAAEEESEEA